MLFSATPQDKPCVNIVGFGIHTQFNTRYSWDRDCAIDGAPTYWGVERDVFLYWRPPSGKWYLALSSRLENIKAGDDQFAFARTQQRGGPDPTPGWIQWEELRVYESREWAWVRADHVHISLSSSPIEVQRRIQEATVKAIEKGTPDSGYVDATNDPTGYSSALLGSAREHGLHLEGCGAEDFEDPDTFVAAAPPQVAPGEEQLPIGLLFPGQGSSHVGMMKEAKDIPAVKEMLHKAQEILGYDILPICLNGPEERLSQTWLCQPAMFIAGLAGLEKLRQEREEAVMRCQAVAGFSLGEYTALCAAGVFSFEVGLELVKLRGEAMQYAVRGGTQGMISVTGLGKARLVELCDRVEKNLGGTAVCKIAIDRFPKGFICGGTNEAIAKLKEYAVQAGSLAAQLPETFGAYHTSLMKHAEDKLRTALAAALPKMRPPRCSVYMNATASPMSAGTPPKRIVALLEKQMTSPVLWEQSVRAMSGDGVGEFYEVSPMKQIKEMLMHTDKAIWRATYNVEV